MLAKNFVILSIVLIVISTVTKIWSSGSSGIDSFSLWIVIGIAVGLAMSTFWVTQQKISQKRLAATLAMTVIVVVGFFGVAMVDLARNLKLNTQAAQDWPSVNAKVMGSGIFSSTPTKTSRRWWAATWFYEYEYLGQKYKSESQSAKLTYILNPKNSEVLARADSGRRPVGTFTVAYVNPQYPEQSVLDRKAFDSSEFYLYLTLGLSSIIVSAVAIWSLMKRIRS